jgi:hypothetical protein
MINNILTAVIDRLTYLYNWAREQIEGSKNGVYIVGGLGFLLLFGSMFAMCHLIHPTTAAQSHSASHASQGGASAGGVVGQAPESTQPGGTGQDVVRNGWTISSIKSMINQFTDQVSFPSPTLDSDFMSGGIAPADIPLPPTTWTSSGAHCKTETPNQNDVFCTWTTPRTRAELMAFEMVETIASMLPANSGNWPSDVTSAMTADTQFSSDGPWSFSGSGAYLPYDWTQVPYSYTGIWGGATTCSTNECATTVGFIFAPKDPSQKDLWAVDIFMLGFSFFGPPSSPQIDKVSLVNAFGFMFSPKK